jgi:hypothetical protein
MAHHAFAVSACRWNSSLLQLFTLSSFLALSLFLLLPLFLNSTLQLCSLYCIRIIYGAPSYFRVAETMFTVYPQYVRVIYSYNLVVHLLFYIFGFQPTSHTHTYTHTHMHACVPTPIMHADVCAFVRG